MKFLVGAASLAIIAATGFYLTSQYVAYRTDIARQKVASDVQYCEQRLGELKKFRLNGTLPAALSESSMDFIVGGCASKDRAFAARALPYLSAVEASSLRASN